jgi:hypothetical protein
MGEVFGPKCGVRTSHSSYIELGGGWWSFGCHGAGGGVSGPPGIKPGPVLTVAHQAFFANPEGSRVLTLEQDESC